VTAPIPGADDLTRGPLVDPSPLYRTRDELYADDMLIAALKGFDFFTWLDAHPSSIQEIARHFGFHERPVDVMTTLFVARGLLARDGATLGLTALAREHLVASSRWFLGSYFPRVSDRPIALDLIEILKTDKPANYASRKNEDDWHKAMENEAFAEEFLAAMDIRGRLTAHALAQAIDLGGRRRVLDVAGGSGIFACALAARFPDLQAAVFEKPPVDRIAARAIGRRGFESRVGVVAGDMLVDPLPAGYDVHLFSNVLHDWDVPIVRRLIRASADALPGGGEIVIHDTFLDAEKNGPPGIAAYSVLLMHVTQGRCYGTGEIAGWLSEAGFSAPTHVPGAATRSALVARKN
jgi:3-hydroxy-5-methyl-1-naphthoate 3-O-methyltransferase